MGFTNTFIAGISGVAVAGGVGVIIDARGHLGTVVPSEKFKEAIKPMNKTSEAIFSLKPVTFRYKKELDPDGIPQFGLVAEQVEKVNSDLVARDADVIGKMGGDICRIRSRDAEHRSKISFLEAPIAWPAFFCRSLSS
jgi:hypothetical protein